ncbi:Transcription factor bHLH149 [Apostasia shenzhenica]|uniref:Transcription factor bHLH149 n=1 Tax=Apostasia shenzhenica TaxID=1088818 RepID=A0A2I0B5D3_9ASPA|nr:Transcription factor bHLH149 [Apostasia shenzhenica]
MNIQTEAAGREEITISDAAIDPVTPSPGKYRVRKRKNGTLKTAQRSACRWRTNYQQRIYCSKLVEALRRVRRTEAPPPAEHPHGRSVRETADRVLAVAARGRTRWSRAILADRPIGVKLRRARGAAAAASCSIRRKKSGASDPAGGRRVNQPSLERKAKLLGRLVPGCRKLSLPSLLDETSDYIAALEMQVRAMSALAEILSASGSGAAGDGAVAAGQLESNPPGYSGAGTLQ